HDDRRRRLHAAAALVATIPPRLVRGDLLDVLDDELARLPAGTTPVVFHSAVLAYLSRERRAEFAERMRRGRDAVWISNEVPGVVAGVEIDLRPPPSATSASFFAVALDGRAVAISDPHGRWVRWPDQVS